MAPKTPPQNCETGHCDDHSGLLVWMKGIAALLAASAALLSYSVFWQAPGIRLEIAREIARLDAKDKDTEFKLQTIEKDIRCINEKVSLLEAK